MADPPPSPDQEKSVSGAPCPDGAHLGGRLAHGKPDRQLHWRDSPSYIPKDTKKVSWLTNPRPQLKEIGGGHYPPKTWEEHEEGGAGVPWKYDSFEVAFSRLKKIEDKARCFELSLDEVIRCWVIDKDEYFASSATGGNDRTTLYSSDSTHKVNLPRLLPQKSPQLSGMSTAEKGHALELRMRFLGALFVQCNRDLVRIWEGDHDGKSCRYYQMDGYPKFPVFEGFPWYLGNGRDFPERWPQPPPLQFQNHVECHFCLAERELFRLEKELIRLKIFKARLGNRRLPPKGGRSDGLPTNLAPSPTYHPRCELLPTRVFLRELPDKEQQRSFERAWPSTSSSEDEEDDGLPDEEDDEADDNRSVIVTPRQNTKRILTSAPVFPPLSRHVGGNSPPKEGAPPLDEKNVEE